METKDSNPHPLIAHSLQHAAHRRQPVGRHTLQAAIALEHVRPQNAGQTEWGRIADLHGLLNRVDDVPAQRIAWAVAAGRAHGPRRGLKILDGVRNGENSYLFHAARADLLKAAGQLAAARSAYARATALAPGDTERAALTGKRQALVDERTSDEPPATS